MPTLLLPEHSESTGGIDHSPLAAYYCLLLAARYRSPGSSSCYSSMHWVHRAGWITASPTRVDYHPDWLSTLFVRGTIVLFPDYCLIRLPDYCVLRRETTIRPAGRYAMDWVPMPFLGLYGETPASVPCSVALSRYSSARAVELDPGWRITDHELGCIRPTRESLLTCYQM